MTKAKPTMKEQELKSEHLIGYLLHGLKMSINKHNEVDLRIGLLKTLHYNEVTATVEINSPDITMNIALTDCKPVLLPLSDYTKEIEQNGVKFKAAERLALHLDDWDLHRYILSGKTEGLPFWIVQKLFEWKFDVFNLIGKNLAISVHELSKNPYK
ncbi:hypothetical protein LCGC14_2436410 [marine sediment metagenome]|uniref:Uncharacterized protein n=1 Tax=marine sediment metagenome TaxID=412755 RepID=A0A0F9BKG8_9ZZZZ